MCVCVVWMTDTYTMKSIVYKYDPRLVNKGNQVVYIEVIYVLYMKKSIYHFILEGSKLHMYIVKVSIYIYI